MKRKSGTIITLISMLLCTISVYAASSAPIKKSSSTTATGLVTEKYELLPDAIQDDFENRGWEIHIVPEKELHKEHLLLGEVPPVGQILGGVTVGIENRIYLNDGVADLSMNHEMGHYVDMVLFGNSGSAPSNTQEFIDIYQTEKGGFGDSYPKSDAHEYFAETFSLYIEYPGDLKKTFPKTYEYMDRIISPYGGTRMGLRKMTKEEKEQRDKSGIFALSWN